MHIFRPTLRGCILVLIIIGASRLGRKTYQGMYDILSFQVTIYERILQTQQGIGNVKDEVGGFIDTASARLAGEEQHAEKLPTILPMEEKLTAFKNKLQMISSLIGTLVGILVFKIGFDIVFGIKKSIYRFRDFVME